VTANLLFGRRAQSVGAAPAFLLMDCNSDT